MRITVFGHASLYIEVSDQRVLIDPVLHTDPLGSGAFAHTHHRALDLARMPEPTVLAITHAHVDHLDARSLQHISRSTPVVAPNDPHTLSELEALGFSEVTKLDEWCAATIGGMRIIATPTDSGVDEVGYLFEDSESRFWHMSDAEADARTGATILERYGRCDAVAAKYQPTTRVMARLFRSLGPAFDKQEVVDWLEAAAATRPLLVFPYASGLSFVGRFAWLNQYLFPYRAREIAELMSVRLAPEGRGECVLPGDVLELDRGAVRMLHQASPFVRHVEGGGETPWEPIDTSHFALCSSEGDRNELAQRLEAVLFGPWAKWLVANLKVGGSVPHALRDLGVSYQLVVHLGNERRFHFAIDFSRQPLRLTREKLASANFTVHMAGGSLLEILRKQAGTELLYACGDALIHERIIAVRDGKIWIPPLEGMELYGRVADPLTFYLRWFGPQDGVVAAGTM